MVKKYIKDNKEYEFVVPEGLSDSMVKKVSCCLLEYLINSDYRLITYGDLVKLAKIDMNPRNIEKYLGPLSYMCIENGLPPISVMVVNKDTLTPGDGFYKYYYSHLKTDKEKEAKCFEMMNKVKEYPNWDVLLEVIR